MATKLWAVLTIFFTTILTSTAQILWKIGSASLEFNVISIIANYYIMGGLILYVIGGSLMVISFRGGEVSVLYPIIATSYVWVTFLSNIFLEENLGIVKLLGVSMIMLGIACIGKGSRNAAPGAI